MRSRPRTAALQPERQALADALRDMTQYDYEDEYAKALALLHRLTASGVRLVPEAEDAASLRAALERDRERIWQALGEIGLGESAPWDDISAILNPPPERETA